MNVGKKQRTQNSFDVVESYRRLGANIHVDLMHTKTILITSVHTQEGKTLTSLRLAKELSGLGEKVLFIDADLRKSRLRNYISLNEEAGLSELLHGEISISDALSNSKEMFDIVSSGKLSDTSTTLLATENFGDAISQWKNVYDRIIIDSSSFGLIADAKIVAKHTDGVILIVQENRTTFEEVKELRNALRGLEIPIIGVILTKVTLKENLLAESNYYDV